MIGAAGVAPLLLYILSGPADGNPIGLGLLAFAAMAVAVVGSVVGMVLVVVERFSSPRGDR